MSHGHIQDAYKPEDGNTYEMLKVVSIEKYEIDSNEHTNTIEEYVRIPKDKYELIKAKFESSGVDGIKGRPEQIAKFKKDMGAVVTDALDANGNQLPGRKITEANSHNKQPKITSIHVKNGKAHDIIMPDGSYKHAVTQTDKVGHTTRYHMIEGKENNVIQPNGMIDFAVTKCNDEGTLMRRISKIDGKKQNLTTAEGELVLAEEEYDQVTGQRDGFKSYVDDQLETVTLANGEVVPSVYSNVSGGHETIEFYSKGLEQSPTINGVTLPSKAGIYKGEVDFFTYHDKGQLKNQQDMPGSVRFYHNGQISDIRNEKRDMKSQFADDAEMNEFSEIGVSPGGKLVHMRTQGAPHKAKEFGANTDLKVLSEQFESFAPKIQGHKAVVKSQLNSVAKM